MKKNIDCVGNKFPPLMAISPFITLCTCVVFIASVLVGPCHFAGDQLAYADAYQAVAGLQLFDAYDAYRRYLDSAEIIHFFVIWIGSNAGVDKNILMSFANALLAYGILKLFREWKVADWVSATFVFSNFYLLVLYFTTERLKFSFIFVVLSLVYSRSIVSGSLLAVVAVLAHVQNAILYSSIAFYIWIPRVIKIRWSFARVLLGIFLVATVGLCLYLFGGGLIQHIESKVGAYAASNTKPFVSDVLVMLCLFVASLYYASKKSLVLLMFLPNFYVLSILGSDRVNMIGYLCFMYFSFRNNRGVNLGVIATSMYLFVKGLNYLYYLFTTGNGFGY